MERKSGAKETHILPLVERSIVFQKLGTDKKSNRTLFDCVNTFFDHGFAKP
jgi:hypothetical protein